MSNNINQILKITATHNSNGTVLITFIPSESTWQFTRNNRLNLFNKLHYIVSLGTNKKMYNYENQEGDEDSEEFVKVSPVTLDQVENKIRETLVDWIRRGDLIIK